MATEIGKFLWGATLIVAWLVDLSWLITASLKQAPIGLDLTFAAFLVLATAATMDQTQRLPR